MNVSYRWLKALAPRIDDSPRAVADRLTYTAVPVDEVAWLGEGLEGIVIGRVEEVSEHPNADRLVICQVDIGNGQRAQVVTGAPNVVEGAFYPFVGEGGSLPDGTTIERAKLRGEYSEGMLCSERELGLGRDHAGIMRLSGEFAAGEPLVEALGLDDHRLVLDITPNRPDLLGHLGVARELAPGGVDDLELPAFPEGRDSDYGTLTATEEGSTAGVPVRIEDPDGCPRYMGVVIRGVEVGPSPEWLAARLRSVGLQPINNVVDSTNYVLYELNQPLHAFDLDKLRGPEIGVRRAREKEALRTLDGKQRELDPEILVIADADGACALAGVMGGEDSEVSAETRDLFIECAYFDPGRVRAGARRLGLDTDASYRFQRGIDPEGLPAALRRTVDLMLTVAGGRVDGDAVDVYPQRHVPIQVALRPERVGRLLGVELGESTIRECLEPLGFSLNPGVDASLTVDVPSWRPDVTREVDLIEEIARRHGYQRFPDELGPFRPTSVREEPYAAALDRLRDTLVALGFFEARTLPLVGAGDGEIRIRNPLSEREAYLRGELLSGLVRRAEHNLGQGQRDVRLFEIGTVFHSGEDVLPKEQIRAAAVWTGARTPAHWTGDAAEWDVWDLKWIFDTVGRTVARRAELRPLDPGEERSPELEEAFALVDSEGRARGWAGRIPARRVDAPAWAGEVWGFEVEVRPERGEPPSYSELPVYPAVERDIALLVPRDTLAAEVEAAIRTAAAELLAELSVFDVYEGENIPDGMRSIAWRLRFRSSDRTLTDDEVDVAMERIASQLEDRLNVRIRGA